MPCFRFPKGIICGIGNPYTKFKAINGTRYYMDFHSYCGPTFYKDADQTEEYDMTNIPKEIWDQFEIWLEKKGK